MLVLNTFYISKLIFSSTLHTAFLGHKRVERPLRRNPEGCLILQVERQQQRGRKSTRWRSRSSQWRSRRSGTVRNGFMTRFIIFLLNMPVFSILNKPGRDQQSMTIEADYLSMLDSQERVNRLKMWSRPNCWYCCVVHLTSKFGPSVTTFEILKGLVKTFETFWE